MKFFPIFLFLFFISINLSAQNNKKDTPKGGEGINQFLERNGYPSKTYRDAFIELNKKKLGENNVMKLGVYYNLPDSSSVKVQTQTTEKVVKKGKEPLFGKALEDYEIISDELKGACFYLSSGHGGPDPGANLVLEGHRVCEDEYAYDIMLRIARGLLMHGAKVHIIIQDANDGIRNDKYLTDNRDETCMGDPIPRDRDERLIQRRKKINELYAKEKNKYKHHRCVFIHLDSVDDKNPMDSYFFYYAKSEAGKKLAETVQEKLRQKYKDNRPQEPYKGKIKPNSDFGVLVKTHPVGIYMELGNIQSPRNHQRFFPDWNRQHLADWLREGLMDDYKNVKKGK